jgi:hypothetical protein
MVRPHCNVSCSLPLTTRCICTWMRCQKSCFLRYFALEFLQYSSNLLGFASIVSVLTIRAFGLVCRICFAWVPAFQRYRGKSQRKSVGRVRAGWVTSQRSLGTLLNTGFEPEIATGACSGGSICLMEMSTLFFCHFIVLELRPSIPQPTWPLLSLYCFGVEAFNATTNVD